MTDKPKILFFYDYFFPGYKAGGPVQSLTNLIGALQYDYSFSVITTAYDLLSNEPYPAINQNEWNNISLPNVQEQIKVWYAGKRKPSYFELKMLLLAARPNIIYLNGVYSFRLFLLPLFINLFSLSARVVVCPRGMLQSGALSVKSGKKKYYIRFLQKSKLLNKVVWHATNTEEANDITRLFPNNKGVFIASNIPKNPLESIALPNKKEGELKLVYLSLITEKKNLLLLLQIMKGLPNNIKLDIYGPVKDSAYWAMCSNLIGELKGTVKYMGDIQPDKVQETLSHYHSMILLTKGENFGHALYECLSVGRPLITSHFTPWNNLEQLKAGANVDISDGQNCSNKIQAFANFSQIEYDVYCHNAHSIANQYFGHLQSRVQYKLLFEEDSL